MTPLSTNAPNAGSDSIPENDNRHLFPWKWNLTDLEQVKKNGLNVFSCFSCGGGSTMGYKLAGYTVIGNCEIDRDMNKIYNINHHPKYSYLMDVRDFYKQDNTLLPKELFHLDILDGSPPCSVFSMAGQRDKGWGTEKVFREGQKKQRLDDLFFAFIDIAEKLKPKVVVAENVKGLVTGNAKGYVHEIFKAFKAAGYTPQLFLLNSARMGVPQARERVFFIAHRNDLKLPKLKLDFQEPIIPFGSIRSEKGVPVNPDTEAYRLLQMRLDSDTSMADINERLSGKNSGYTIPIVNDNRVCCTVVSGSTFYRGYDGTKFTKQDFVSAQTFPQDYDFLDQSPQYVCGMSVPPVMEAQIARQIYLQWLRFI